MPRCVDCGLEVSYHELQGPPEQLRCPSCAAPQEDKSLADTAEPERPVQPVVTIVLCAAAVLVSLAYWSNLPVAAEFSADPVAYWQGEVWRLFTTVLPHVNLLHLVFNIYWTWRFGQIIERWLGHLRFAGLVALLAVGSSAGSFLLSEHGVGLSGVGYGLFALLFALRRDKDFAAREMQPGVIQLWVIWFFFCLVTTWSGAYAVGNAAHGAGAILGWLVGRSVLSVHRTVQLAGLVVLVAGLVLATHYMPWDGRYAWYQGNRHIDRGEYAEALPWLEKAARAFPENQELHVYVAWLRDTVKEQKGH